MNSQTYIDNRKVVLDKKKKASSYANLKYIDEKIERKPEWLKVPLPSGDNYSNVKKDLRSKKLWTVCEEANCPNLSECWSNKTATMMILGGTCTRACKFCNVDTGNPKGVLDHSEPENAANMVGTMGLKYIVITSVDRDDLHDFGAGHFAKVVNEVNKQHPNTLVEVLIPDFDAQNEHMHTLAKSNPFVVAQNIETVNRLTKRVRDSRAGYEKTLKCLEFYKKNYPHMTTKTSLMLGLGETKVEVVECLKDLRGIGVNIVTFGQYLRPTKNHLPVDRYVTPKEFEEFKEISYDLGFDFVASGPLVRSSYKAADYLNHLEKKGLWPR
jgi:lipoyl synthase